MPGVFDASGAVVELRRCSIDATFLVPRTTFHSTTSLAGRIDSSPSDLFGREIIRLNRLEVDTILAVSLCEIAIHTIVNVCLSDKSLPQKSGHVSFSQ